MSFEACLAADTLAIDTETNGLSPWRGDRPFMWSFCTPDGESFVVEFQVDPRTRSVNYDAVGRRQVARLLGDRKTVKVFWNAKFDVRMSEAAGFRVEGQIEEGMFAAHVCRSNEPDYKLKPYAARHIDYPIEDQTRLQKAVVTLRNRARKLGWRIASAVEADYWLTQYAAELLKGTKREDEADEIKGMCAEYAVCDVERTILTWLYNEKRMADYEVRDVYDFEMRKLWPVVYAMETRGVHLDREAVKAGAAWCRRRIRDTEATIKNVGGDNFNPNSAPQKIKYFIEERGFKPLALTKKKNPSVDNDFLQSIEHLDPLARAIIDHGKASKALGTYFLNYLASMDEDDVIHPSAQQLGPVTGRFSFRDPNLQNVPKRGEPGDALLKVREPFGPRDGFNWYCMDYMQIEARIFAERANEETMLKAFAACRDVYAELATTINELTGIEVSRQAAKGIFLGKLYGLGKDKMIRQLRTDEDSALAVISAFDETFPGVREFMQDMIRLARKQGYIVNMYGRVVPIDRDFAYKATNADIQSAAADLMKRAMVASYAYIQEHIDEVEAYLVCTIHDELVFEVRRSQLTIPYLRGLKAAVEDNGGMFKKVATTMEVKRVIGSWLEPRPVKWAA